MNQAKKILFLTGLEIIFSFQIFAQWSPVGNVIANKINDLVEWKGKLYIAGINVEGNDTVCGVISYDGINFIPLNTNYGFWATPLEVYNDTLLLGGYGGVAPCNPSGPSLPGTQNIIKWDGNNWFAVGGGGPGGVEIIDAMAVYNGELYVGGNFLSMGGVNVNRIARWDGTQWKDVGGGVMGSIPQVTAMAVYNGFLYVGGTFGNAGGTPAYNIARWNGTQWDSVGWGTDGIVQTLYVDTVDNLLYAGGGFYNAGGIFTGCFAKWNGNNWSATGNLIFYGNILAITRYNNKIVVGGLSITGSSLDTVIATWDGTYWCPIVPGPNNTVSAMEVYNGELYIGGYFDTVATIPAKNLIKWSGTLCPNSAINETIQEIKFKVYPNPARAEININVEGEENKEYIARIYNSVGAKAIEQKFTKQTKLSTENFSKGIYQVQVCESEKDGKICHTEKVVLE